MQPYKSFHKTQMSYITSFIEANIDIIQGEKRINEIAQQTGPSQPFESLDQNQLAQREYATRTQRLANR